MKHFLVTMMVVLFFQMSSLVLSSEPNSPLKEKLYFYESFDDKEDIFTSGKWVKSLVEKYASQPVVIRPSTIAAEEFKHDNGLALSQSHKYYGLSSKFPTPLDVKGKDLVIQYELKLEQTLNCGGAYIKMPRVSDSLDLTMLDNETPYSIMFGPDRCGPANNKVHFIMQHQNPKSLAWEEKHSNDTATVKSDTKTHLYTLHIKSADNSFAVYVDKKEEKKGNLLTHMVPPINPQAIIDDPTDFKPIDWVDAEKIPDPLAVKPDDWDESQPRTIVDPQAVKPKGWLDDAPLEIPDPQSSKPEDWDDEEDGEWEAPLVSNPACNLVGCGEWKPSTINNPEYKGKWTPPMITNPAYKGVWKAKQIENPNYFVDNHPSDFTNAAIAGLAVEVWTTDAGIFFDNFVVAVGENALNGAFALADATFVPKQAAETKEAEQLEKQKREKARQEKLEKGDLRSVLEARVAEVMDLCAENPVISVITVICVLLGAIVLLFPNQNKNAAENASSSRATTRSGESSTVASDNTVQTPESETKEQKDDE